MPDDATAGSELVEKFAPGAPAAVKAKAEARINAYLLKTYDKINLGRSSPPGIMYKSGAASLLAMWRKPTAVKLR